MHPEAAVVDTLTPAIRVTAPPTVQGELHPMTMPQTAREVAPRLEQLARIGYAAKALLYATVGILAAQAALGRGGRTTDLAGALREVVRAPMGDALLLVIALGLAGYAVWRIVDAITDAEGKGGDAKGIARRLGSAARGLAHGVLAVAAFHLATGSRDDSADDKGELASRAVDIAGGAWLLWVAAGAILAYACYQLYRAYAAKLGSQLDLGAVSAGVGRWVIGLSRAGLAARGIVFGLIGVLLVRAARHEAPEEAGGIRDSLEMLGGMGRWPLAVVGLGLVAYAVYELLNARYRRIRVA
jgi:hypothetical protein